MAPTNLRPHPHARGPGGGLQTVARRRARLARYERRPRPAPRVPLSRGPDPRPHPIVLAGPAADPSRGEHHRRHLAQHPPRTRPSPPDHPRLQRRPRRATLHAHSRSKADPGRARRARAAEIPQLHRHHQLKTAIRSPGSCSNTTPTATFRHNRRSTPLFSKTCAHQLRKSGQGLGAMLTMPLAGRLVDKMPVGRVVPFGILGIILGMGVFTQLSVDTLYALVLGALFVMGMGMGATMMPIMTSALKALNDHEIARGSTLVNIVQQIASSVGAAVMSVVLTNNIKGSEAASALAAAQNDPSIMERLTPDVIARGLADMTDGFAMVFAVSLALVIATLIPVLLMPRKHEESHIGEGADGVEGAEGAPPVLLH